MPSCDRRDPGEPLYGALTVLFVLVADRVDLGPGGYGYRLSASAIGGVLAAGAAGRAAA